MYIPHVRLIYTYTFLCLYLFLHFVLSELYLPRGTRTNIPTHNIQYNNNCICDMKYF